MALEQWNIKPATRRCIRSGKELKEGQEVYSVLFEDGDGFRREDYSPEAWTGPPEGAFCHFKTRVPLKEKRDRLLVDEDTLINFFVRLGDTEDEAKLRFRFVLALILMRKRLLRYEQTRHEGDREYWQMRLAREPNECGVSKDNVHTVVNPHLDDKQIESVSRELSVILHGYTPEDGDDADTRIPLSSKPSSADEVCDA